MYPLTKKSLKQFEQTVTEFCKTNRIPVRSGQNALESFLEGSSNTDLFLLWDALGCDGFGFRENSAELQGLYVYLGDLYVEEAESAAAQFKLAH